jgi:hypothetical protein
MSKTPSGIEPANFRLNNGKHFRKWVENGKRSRQMYWYFKLSSEFRTLVKRHLTRNKDFWRHTIPLSLLVLSISYSCAVFSLEPLAQDPRQSEITDMRYINLFTSLPLPCSTLTEAWQFLVVITCLVVWGVNIAKIWFGADGKILFRSVLRRGQGKGEVPLWGRSALQPYRLIVLWPPKEFLHSSLEALHTDSDLS